MSYFHEHKHEYKHGWTGNKVWGLILMAVGVLGTSVLLAAAVGNAVNGEPAFLSSYVGLTLLLIAAAATLTGFCLLANWTDPFPVDDPSAPVVRQFDDDQPQQEDFKE